MITFSQGDILKIDGYKYRFLIVSKNAFIKSTGVFHVCPIIRDLTDGPLHIKIKGKKNESGTALCEQIKMIDPSSRSCSIIDTIPYDSIMNISDAIQGIFEYD
jgi:mRNA interferase MazF